MIVKLEFEIDSRVWVSGFTRRHPEITVEALNVMAISQEHLLAEFDVHGPAADYTGEIEAFPDVVGVERLAVGSEVGRYRVRYRVSPMFKLEKKYEILVRYPAMSQDGLSKIELVGPLSRIRSLTRYLRSTGNNPRLVSLAPDSFRSDQLLLTPTQRTLFRQALGSGYFDVPRRITLTQLAQKVSRSKSSVSQLLALVEQKLAKAA